MMIAEHIVILMALFVVEAALAILMYNMNKDIQKSIWDTQDEIRRIRLDLRERDSRDGQTSVCDPIQKEQTPTETVTKNL